MKIFLLLALVCLIVYETQGKDIKCETLGSYKYGDGPSMKTCVMKEATIIESKGYIISSPTDETIEGLVFEHNKKIQFLPEKIAEKIPNIIFYTAWNLSLTEVSKINFINLTKLKILYLDNNLIETFASDTFEDLTSLMRLHLRKRNFCFY